MKKLLLLFITIFIFSCVNVEQELLNSLVPPVRLVAKNISENNKYASGVVLIDSAGKIIILGNAGSTYLSSSIGLSYEIGDIVIPKINSSNK